MTTKRTPGTESICLLCLSLVLGLLWQTAPAQVKKDIVVCGIVVDGNGSPLPSANVQIVGTFDGDVTDVAGRFRFFTGRTGKQELRGTIVGMHPAVAGLNLSHGDSVFVRLELKEAPIDLSEVTVTAGGYMTGDEVKGMTLKSLEVVTTPGAAADIFRAVQTFPGVTAVDEGSGLFVRGGDVSETVILLDQSTLTHPYKFETPTGGVFGTIPPYLISGTYFSTGGFSARYGNALSGILAMESRDLPDRFTFFLNAGLAAGSVGADIPIIPGTLGFSFSGNQSFTDLMFRINGVRNQFTLPPDGRDANFSMAWHYSQTGRLKFLTCMNDDRLGVRVDEPSFEGVYESTETSWLHSLQWSDAIGPWFLKGGISTNRFLQDQHLGNLQLHPSDVSLKLRVDGERLIRDDLRLAVGTEVERLENSYTGSVPVNQNILDPNAEVFQLNDRFVTQRWGSYAELEARLSQRLAVSGGARVDYQNLAREAVIDPRLSLKYNLSQEENLHASWGIYHQFPQPILYDPASGNPSLRAQQAQHLVAGIEHTGNLLLARLELYHKSYWGLVLLADNSHYANCGSGYADGLDVFLKYGAFLQTPFNGWISYSFLHSRRLQARDLVDQIVYESAPSSFDITHSLTIVAKIQLIGFLSAGSMFRYATGRPETPVIGAVPQEGGAYYLPIQGPVNSYRLTAFSRLDATLSYFLPFGDLNSAVFYISLTNVLDRANAAGVEYSKDYSVSRLRLTDYRRFIYFGVSLSLGSLRTDDL